MWGETMKKNFALFGSDSFFCMISSTRNPNFRIIYRSPLWKQSHKIALFHIKVRSLCRQLVQKIQAAVTDDIGSVSVI